MAGLLDEYRATLDRLLPGLDDRLAEIPLERLESRESEGIEVYREMGGAPLLVPKEHGGIGATPLEAAQVQAAIGARSPSLAIAACMHNFSVAALVGVDEDGSEFEAMLFQPVAEEGRLLASGFAEGRSAQGVFEPTMTARRAGDEYLVNGSKKPCSLAHSFNVLTASVEFLDNGAESRYGVALIASDLPGIEVEPFWAAPVLGGAQSEAVILKDVPVEADLVLEMGTVGHGHLDDLQSKGLTWFEIMMTASYLGVATALVDRVIQESRGDASVRALAAIEVDAAMSAIEGICTRIAAGEHDNRMLARTLSCRFAVQDAITRGVAMAVEQLGGIAFITGPEVSYLAAASRAISLHPPSRSRALGPLVPALLGEGLDIR